MVAFFSPRLMVFLQGLPPLKYYLPYNPNTLINRSTSPQIITNHLFLGSPGYPLIHLVGHTIVPKSIHDKQPQIH